MTKFKFGGIDNPDIYLDETVMRMCYTHRRMFSMLATQLMKEGQKDKALKVVEKALKEIPATTVPHNYQSGSLDLARVLASLGKTKPATEIATTLAKNAAEYCAWYTSLSDAHLQQNSEEVVYQLYQLNDAIKILETCAPKDKTASTKMAMFDKLLEQYSNELQSRVSL